MPWKVALDPSIYQDVDGVQRHAPGKVDYVIVREGGVLEVGYVEGGQQQVDMYLAPDAWLWVKRLP